MNKKPLRAKPLPPTFPGAMMIDEKEKRAVVDVLDSKALFRYYGPEGSLNKTKRFEEDFAQYMGTDYALAVSSGTPALCIALTAAGIGPGDEVIVPGYTWIASALSVVASRAVPIIAEIDKSLNLDPKDFEAKITERTKAVMPVHMRGVSCRMEEIMDIAKNYGLKVIEDNAQSCGGEYKGKKLGSIGDIGMFSFQLNKIITAGEGGALTTNDKSLFERCIMIHDVATLREGPKIWWEFETEPIMGLNYRMNEYSSAILIEQLQKLDGILNKTKSNKEKIRKGISDIEGIELRDLPDKKGDTSICLMFFLPSAEKAQRFVDVLRDNNINGPGYGTHVAYISDKPDWHVYTYWYPLIQKRTFTKEGCPFKCPYYKAEVEYSEDMCPKTLNILSRTVHLDVSPLLTEEDIDSIIEGIHYTAQKIL
jgi:dTDP-4-amino-4,6-dideoxygalactose transaminase